MENLTQLLLDNNVQLKDESSLSELDRIEELIGFKLPDDYKFFLQNFTAFEGFIGKEYLALWDLNSVMENNAVVDISLYMPSTVAIGDNGSGELLIIEILSQDNYKVFITPQIDMDKQYNIEIGTSFTNFITKLDNNEEWFK